MVSRWSVSIQPKEFVEACSTSWRVAEPSLGLAPLVVQRIFEIIQHINRTLGTTMVLVEQNARVATEIASYVYVLDNGRVVLEGDARTLRRAEAVEEAYFGNKRARA